MKRTKKQSDTLLSIYRDARMPLAILLRASRERIGKTQKEVADHLGYAQQFLSNWENGVSEPPAEVLGAICSLYGVKLTTLVDLMDSVQSKIFRDVVAFFNKPQIVTKRKLRADKIAT